MIFKDRIEEVDDDMEVGLSSVCASVSVSIFVRRSVGPASFDVRRAISVCCTIVGTVN